MHTLEKHIDKIDCLRRRIELAPKWMRARLHWVHRELEELRALVVKARMKAHIAPYQSTISRIQI